VLWHVEMVTTRVSPLVGSTRAAPGVHRVAVDVGDARGRAAPPAGRRWSAFTVVDSIGAYRMFCIASSEVLREASWSWRTEENPSSCGGSSLTNPEGEHRDADRRQVDEGEDQHAAGVTWRSAPCARSHRAGCWVSCVVASDLLASLARRRRARRRDVFCRYAVDDGTAVTVA